MPGYQYPRRPPRLERHFRNVRPFYFVTFNTYRRRPLLARQEVHKTFCNFCTRGQDRAVAVGRYVIMPDHLHLFVALPPDSISLDQWVQALRSVIGKKLLALRVMKPYWQEGFFDHLLRSGESYSQKWEYVQMNPVRARLCEKPEDWPFQGEIMSLPFD